MQQHIQQLAQQFIDTLHGLEQGDERALDAMAELFSEDTRLTNSALKLAGDERTGTAGAREFWAEYQRTFGQARSDFHQVTVSEEAAGLFWTTRGTANNGQPMEYDGASLLVFDGGGKIRRFHGYYDTRQLTREVGVERQPGSAAR